MRITPEYSDSIFEGIEIPNDREVRKQTAIAKRELAGWHEKLVKSHNEPAYLEKIRHLNRARSQDPEYRKKMDQKNKKMAKDPAWIEAHGKAAHARKTDEEWLAKCRENGKKLKKNKKWKKNVTAANLRKAKDPEFQAKRVPKYEESHKSDSSAYTRKRCRPMQTQFGIFFKVSEVIKYIKDNNIDHPKDPGTLRRYIAEDSKPDWYYITWEEYDKLTK